MRKVGNKGEESQVSQLEECRAGCPEIVPARLQSRAPQESRGPRARAAGGVRGVGQPFTDTGFLGNRLTRRRPVRPRSGGNVVNTDFPAHCPNAGESGPNSRKESKTPPCPPKAGTNPSFPAARAKNFGSQGRLQTWTPKASSQQKARIKGT